MKNLIMKYLILLVFSGSVAHATLSLDIQPKSIQLGQTARLVITQTDVASATLPNLIPLQADFNIVGTQRSTSYTIVNGQTSSSNQWIIIVMPKKTGVLTIPPIKVGTEITRAGSLNVGNTATTQSSSAPATTHTEEVMLKTAVSNKTPYINEQVLYTVKLYNSRNLINASYEPPSVENGLFIPIGDGRHYQADENGQTYNVEEQQYVFFPQHSGEVAIRPPSLNALVYDAIPQPIQVKGKELTFNVQSPPAEFKSLDWLPAKKIILTQQFDDNTEKLNQGSTLTREITFKAIGFPAQLLPTLNFSNTNSFSVYPEKAKEKNTSQYNEIIGSREMKVTYLLNHPGKITIPAIKIVWFNTGTRKKEIAELPEKIITVIGSTKSAVIKQDSQTTTVTPKTNNQSSTPQTNNSLGWWVAGGFALAWLATLITVVVKRRPIKRPPKNKLSTLKKACLNNDAKLAKTELLAWAIKQWPTHTILSVTDLYHVDINPEFKEEIDKLLKAAYGFGTQPWQGQMLWQCIVNYKPMRPNKLKNITLPPINP